MDLYALTAAALAIAVAAGASGYFMHRHSLQQLREFAYSAERDRGSNSDRWRRKGKRRRRGEAHPPEAPQVVEDSSMAFGNELAEDRRSQAVPIGLSRTDVVEEGIYDSGLDFSPD